MKKNLTSMILCFTISISILSSCGKTEDEPIVKNAGIEEVYVEEDSSIDVTVETDDEEISEKEVSVEEVPPRLYDRDPEWDNVEYPTQTVQIEDMLFIMGMTVEEVMETIDNSSINYIYEYNPDEIIEYTGDFEGYPSIDIYRKDETGEIVNWFTFYCYSPYKKSIPIKECILTTVDLITYQNARPYCRFAGGYSLEDFFNMTGDDIYEMNDGIFENHKCSGNKESQLDFLLPYPLVNITAAPEGSIEIPLLEDSDYAFYAYSQYTFGISKSTGLVDMLGNLRIGSRVYDKETGYFIERVKEFTQTD